MNTPTQGGQGGQGGQGSGGEGPPKFPPGQTFRVVDLEDPLHVEWRSCLLRAARRALMAMEDELERHRHLDSRYAQAVIDATQMELDCLQAGIAWLWRQAL